MITAQTPRPVFVVLAARDGAAFLPEQIASLEAQTWTGWRLVAGDDGSTDGTADLLALAVRARPGEGNAVHRGPGAGIGAHFLSLLARVPAGHPVAFCDQDDVWHPERLARAMVALTGTGGGPAVYASRTLRTDRKLRPIGPTPAAPRGPSFGNALVQNILPGNSIVMNADGADLIRATVPGALAHGVPFHDWWVYLVMTGAGARIVLDDAPEMLLYRQHGSNQQGSARLARLGQAMRRRYAGWIDANLAGLGAEADRLTPANRHLLEGFLSARTRGPSATIRALRDLGIRRQTTSGDRALWAMARIGLL